MKNKVLRLAIVAVLVVAMVLSMAACNDPKPVVTEKPTPVVTPTPTKTPDKTPDKTPTPTPVTPSAADDSALAKATYGIELKGEDFTYGKIVDANDATKKFSEVKVVFSKDLLENFKPLKTADYVKWSVEYEGEGSVKNDNVAYTTSVDAVTGVPTLTFTKVAPAGVYTVHATVKVEDKGFNFGRFGAIKADTVTYELTKIINVNKADLTIKTPSYVAPIEVLADGVSKAPLAPTFSVKLSADTIADDITATKDSETKTLNKNITAEEALYDNLVKAYGDKYDFYLRAASMIDTTKVGSYELILSAHKAGTTTAKEENIIPFAEIPAINHNVTFETGKQYFVDAYDWNAIRDVATSILEINAVKGVDQLNKVKLARARYDALTDAQKAFFTTGVVAKAPAALTYLGQTTVGSFKCDATQVDATVELVVPEELLFDVKETGWTAGSVKAITTGNTAKTIYGILTAAETTFKDNAVIEAWNKAVKDSKFLDYAKLNTADVTAPTKLTSFNIENATHVASYNAVKAYFDALSDADKAAVEATFTWTDAIQSDATAVDGVYQPTEVITSENGYTAFFLVSGLFGVKAVKEVQTLIAAAAAAYNRAVENSPVLSGAADSRVFKAIYMDVLAKTAKAATATEPAIKVGDNAYNGVVYYLNNAEVVAVTNQANAAYEKLSDDQKALLATAVEADADTAKIILYFDVDARNYDTLLGALVAMNKVVGYMEQVISHTNIEDLQHKFDKTPAYNALNRIVYGTSGNYLTYSKGADIRTSYNAVGDIMRAYATDSASLDAVVAEYKAMIDYILAAEAYKAEQVAALNALIATEFVAENHTESEIAVATASTNPVLAGIVNGIRMEQNPAFQTKKGTDTAVVDAATGIVGNGKTVQTILNGNVESYDEAKAAFEGLYNLDKAMSVFMKNYSNTVVTEFKNTVNVVEMLFTKLNVTFA